MGIGLRSDQHLAGQLDQASAPGEQHAEGCVRTDIDADLSVHAPCAMVSGTRSTPGATTSMRAAPEPEHPMVSPAARPVSSSSSVAS